MFVAGESTLSKDTVIQVLMPKDMNLREQVDCTLRILVYIDEKHTLKELKALRYINQDRLITLPELKDVVKDMLRIVKEKIKAIASGINLLPEFYIEIPGIDNEDIYVKGSILRGLEAIDEYSLEANLISIYTTLTSYKGTDTLQQRKFKRMIESIEYMNERGF